MTFARLQSCSRCRAEFETLTESFSAVNCLSLLWAEQEASRRVPVPLPAIEKWRARSLWAIPATVAVIWAVILTVNQAQHYSETPQVDSAVSSSYTVADDNQLMADINREINIEIVPQVPISSCGNHRSACSGMPHLKW